MVNATSIIEISSQLFVGVPGVVIGGWVGFGLFIVAAGVICGLTYVHWVPNRPNMYQLLGFCGLMVVSYLLAATEQFVLARDKDDDVNLLMVVVNGFVWLWSVMGTGRRTRLRPSPVTEKYALCIAVISQVLFLISAFVWNGTVYALWVFALLLMMAAILHYGYGIIENWPHADKFTRAWLWWALIYTFVYMFAAFLSHLYLAALSLSAAVWVYLVMHLSALGWLLFSCRRERSSDIGSVLPQQKGRVSAEASFNPSLASADDDGQLGNP